MKTNTSHRKELRLRPIAQAIALACSAMALNSPAVAQDDSANRAGVLEEVIVTAQKRDENVQDVPISINVLPEQLLTELGVRIFEDYVQYLPNVSYVQLNPSRSEIYMRGISAGGNSELGGASNVAVYLDEQPVTTASTYLNPHIYDINRIEVLAGPQGTLFGANAQSGAIRIITNKPDPGEFSAGYDLEVNSVDHGGVGYVGEGHVNIPMWNNRAALRLVGWWEEDAGYIDNLPFTHTFRHGYIRNNLTDPELIAIAQDLTYDNAAAAGNDFNEATTKGARAALRVNLNDNWTATAMVLRQELETTGAWDHDPVNVGDLQVRRLMPESEDDKFTQTSLTVEGQLGKMTLTYSGSYLDRHYLQDLDYALYSDYYIAYSYVPAYYSCYVSYFHACVDPRIIVTGDERYKRWNHEVRLTSDPESRFRWLLGAFYEDSKWISDLEFHVLGLAEFSQFDSNGAAIPGASAAIDSPDIYWTTDVDKYSDETAVFGQLEYDFTDKLTGSVSARHFDYNARVFGFSGTIWWPTCCYMRPAANVDQSTSESDIVYRGNLRYSFTDDVMVYVTYSEGYRPGGINRAFSGPIPPAYTSDILTNHEVGIKSTLLDGRLRLNGAVYFQDWDDFQLSYLDLDIAPITLTANIGKAESNGVEGDIAFIANDHWEFAGAFSYNKAELTQDYYQRASDIGVTPPTVAKGEPLPRVPDWKWNTRVRYNASLWDHPSYVQATYSYTGSSWSQFVNTFRDQRQQQDSYAIMNFSWGVSGSDWDAEFFIRNVTDERGEIFIQNESWYPTITTNQPRTYGLRWRQRFK